MTDPGTAPSTPEEFRDRLVDLAMFGTSRPELVETLVLADEDICAEGVRNLVRSIVSGSTTADMAGLERLHASAVAAAGSSDADAGARCTTLAGALGFALFSRAAEDLQRARVARLAASRNRRQAADDAPTASPAPRKQGAEEDAADRVALFLKDPDVVAFIVTEYALQPSPDAVSAWEFVNPVGFDFWRAGTTSFILEGTLKGSSKHVAVKILKFQFKDNERINKQTEEYVEQYGRGDGSTTVPAVHDTGKSWVLMEFIVGRTLREYLDEPPLQLDRLALAKTVVTSLAEALMSFACKSPAIYHYDLSPENLIIEGVRDGRSSDGVRITKGEICGIRIIDWGFNYLLTERVGSLHAIAQLQSYVAPELLGGGTGRGVLSDMYSVGSMLLEIVSGQRLTPSNKDHLLDEVWKSYPSIAAVVVELIDTDPDNRLFAAEVDREADLYDVLEDELDDSYKIVEQQPAESGGGVDGLVQSASDIVQVLGFSPQIVGDAIRRWRRVRDSAAAGPALHMVTWMLVTSVANVLMLALLAWATNQDFQNNQVVANGPSRLVSFTFVIVSAGYYLHIFSTLWIPKLSPASDPAARILAPIASASMRLMSFWFVVPVTLATLFPTQWPFAASIGIIVVAFNNLLTYRLARRGATVSELLFEVPAQGLEDILDQYKRWWWLMLVFGLAVGGIGILLALHTASPVDVWAYVILCSLVNIKMLVVNVWQLGPTMRAGMDRAYSGLKRADQRLRIGE